MTYLCKCRPRCSSRRTDIPDLSFGHTQLCRRTGLRPVGRTRDSNHIRRGCVARLVRKRGPCWCTGTGRRSGTEPVCGQDRKKIVNENEKKKKKWSVILFTACYHIIKIYFIFVYTYFYRL